MSFELDPPYHDPLSRHWRLNPILLSDSSFAKYYKEQWDIFLSANSTPDVSASILWETAKAFMRGTIISYTSAKRKKKIKAQLELEDIINKLETEFKSSPTKKNRQKLETARSSLDQLLTEKAQQAIFQAKHKFFEHGNKPGKLLARLVKGRKEQILYPHL